MYISHLFLLLRFLIVWRSGSVWSGRFRRRCDLCRFRGRFSARLLLRFLYLFLLEQTKFVDDRTECIFSLSLFIIFWYKERKKSEGGMIEPNVFFPSLSLSLFIYILIQRKKEERRGDDRTECIFSLSLSLSFYLYSYTKKERRAKGGMIEPNVFFPSLSLSFYNILIQRRKGRTKERGDRKTERSIGLSRSFRIYAPLLDFTLHKFNYRVTCTWSNTFFLL